MIIKIALAGIAVCVINILLKKYLNEFVLPIEIVYISLSVALLSDVLEEIFSAVSEYFVSFEYGDEILSTLLKGMGICLITKFSSDVCAENGNKLVADVIEFSGRIMLTVISLPYFKSVISVALAFLE